MGLLTSPWTLVLLSALWFLYTRYSVLDDLKICPNPLDHADPLTHPECFYSHTHLAAQGLFRTLAKKAGAELFQLPVTESLCIDVAVIRGADNSSGVWHVSGTHGVEGFVGSAIQSAFLAYYAEQKPATKKTIVLVHGLNAFGMANFRRFNENNIDLNRNAIFTEGKWKSVLARDPDVAGYESWSAVFNPNFPPSLVGDFGLILNAARVVIRNQLSRMKRAMVTGTYTSNKGIFYGGTKLEQSHVVVRDFIQKQGFDGQFTKLVVIDVHSGLGPFGNDTFMMNEDVGEAEKLWSTSNAKIGKISWVAPFAFESQVKKPGSGNLASEGYDIMTGDVQSGYHTLFKKLNWFVSVTEEFGTFPGPFVAIELVRENQAYHYGTAEQKLKAGERLRNIFSPLSQSFAEKVIRRGLITLLQGL